MKKQLIAVVVSCVMAATGVQFVNGLGQARADDPPPKSVGYNCDKDVLFVGLRGSGENDKDFDGLGSTVALTRDYLNSQLTGRGRSLTSLAIVDPDYPARPVSDLGNLSNGVLTNTNRYFDGVEAGKTALRNLIDRWSADPACGKQRMVLAGVSQGAMVIHEVINALDLESSAARNRIDGALLIADPDNAASDPNVRQLYANFKGVGIHRAIAVPLTVRDLDSSWGGKAVSVCRSGDPVCAFVGDPTKFGDFYKKGATIHTSYQKNEQRYLLLASQQVKFQFPSYAPQVDASSLNISLTAGTPANAQLKATTDKVCSLSWILRAPPPLPAGLTLSDSGLIAGTPATAGSSYTYAQAIAKCDKRPDRTSPIVRVRISVAKEGATYGDRCKQGTPIERVMPPIKIGQPYNANWPTWNRDCDVPIFGSHVYSFYESTPTLIGLNIVDGPGVERKDRFGSQGNSPDYFVVSGTPTPQNGEDIPDNYYFVQQYTWIKPNSFPMENDKTQKFVFRVPVIR